MNARSRAALSAAAALALTIAAPISSAVAQPPQATDTSTYTCANGVSFTVVSNGDANGPQAWIDGHGITARAFAGAVEGTITVIDSGQIRAIDNSIAPYRRDSAPVNPKALAGTVECQSTFPLPGEGPLDQEFADFLRLDAPELIGEDVIVDLTVTAIVYVSERQLNARV